MRRALILIFALAAFAAMVLPAAAQVLVRTGSYHGINGDGSDVHISVEVLHGNLEMSSFSSHVKVTCGGVTNSQLIASTAAHPINEHGHATFTGYKRGYDIVVGVNFTAHGTATGSISVHGCRGGTDFTVHHRG